MSASALMNLTIMTSAESTHAASVLIQLGAVLFVLGMLGRPAKMIKVLVVPLYLLAGLAFGQGGFVSLCASEAFIRRSGSSCSW
jgi:CPA2 family monovalent cation:H+ antiporter-2